MKNETKVAISGGGGNGAQGNGSDMHGLVRTDEQVRKRFGELFARFKEETKFESNIGRKMRMPTFNKIVALGPQAAPSILREIVAGSRGIWFQVLEDMLEVNPVMAEHEGDSALMAEDWIRWGRNHGLI